MFQYPLLKGIILRGQALTWLKIKVVKFSIPFVRHQR